MRSAQPIGIVRETVRQVLLALQKGGIPFTVSPTHKWQAVKWQAVQDREMPEARLGTLNPQQINSQRLNPQQLNPQQLQSS